MQSTNGFERIHEQYESLLRACACAFAHGIIEMDDLVQEAYVALLQSTHSAEYLLTQPKLIKTIAKRAMHRYAYRPLFKLTVCDNPADLIFDGISGHYERIYLREYLAELERVAGALARSVAEQLLEPDGQALTLAAQEVHARRHGVCCVHTGKQRKHSRDMARLNPTARHLSDALGIGTIRYYRELAAVRRFTAYWLEAA